MSEPAVTCRRADQPDLDVLIELYRRFAAEQTALKEIWPLADGLPEPAGASFDEALRDADTRVYIGEIDGVPFGFLVSRSVPLLPQAEGERVGAIRYIFTEPEARGVGVGEAMLHRALDDLRAAGHTRFDAFALPGHRAAKNFFEAAGFAARSITMHNPGRAS